MYLKNKYYRIALLGAAACLVLQVVLYFAVDPYLVSAVAPLYSIWVILVVVGWRKEHPRR